VPEIGKRVRPVDLRATNAPSDTLVPSYDALSGLFKWIAGGGGPPAVHDKTYHTSPTLPDTDAHKTASPIDHPDGSVTNAKIASGLDAGKITTGTLADARLQYPVNTHKTATPIDHPDASIRPAKLDATNAPSDTQVPSYDAASNLFKWIAAGGGAGVTIAQAKLSADASSNSTSWVDVVDGFGTTLELAFTLASDRNVLMLLSAACCLTSSSTWGSQPALALAFKLDGTRLTGDEGCGRQGANENSPTYPDMWGAVFVAVAFALEKHLAAGTHYLRVQWRKILPTASDWYMLCRPTLASPNDGLEHMRLIAIY